MYIFNLLLTKSGNLMKTQNKLFKLIGAFLVIFALTFSNNINAQNGNGNTDGDITGNTGINDPNNIPGNCGHGPNAHAGNACTGSSDSIPLDGGLGILLLGAAAFGIKKLRA